MATVHLKVDKCPSSDLALTNKVYVHPEDAAALDATRAVDDDTSPRYVEVKGFIFTYDESRKMAKGHFGFTKEQRRCAALALNDEFDLVAYEADTPDVCLSELELEVDYLGKGPKATLTFEVDELSALIKETLVNQFLATSQAFVVVAQQQNLRFIVTKCGVVSLESLTKIAEGAAIEAHSARRGMLMNGTRLTIVRGVDSSLRLSGGAGGAVGGAGLLLDWDFEKMGIGGLDQEFNAIFRRAFASRIYPPAVIAKLGINHVRGILLYGPPGTGKTLMARQIGKMLNGREPKVVSGPEILNKFVGQSEENVRKLFAEAEEEQKKRGLDSDLHIIILDELDAICRARGSRSDSTGVGDTVVNQLLAKIDGVDSLNNILVIGMTNRKELIDPALLRPGRLEVHMEISLPNEEGRVQIVNIHTKKMRENGFLDAAVDLAALAKRMKNYSGAEIEAIVKAATSWAMRRQVDVHNLKKAPKEDELRLTSEDFELALTEVKPSFGVSKEDFEGAVPNGIVVYGDRFARVHSTAHLFVEQVRKSEKTPLVTVLLDGERGAGKSALAATLAITSGYPFVKLVSPELLVGYSDLAKVSKIAEAFDAAYKSPLSVLVVDDVERLIEFVGSVPTRFSNAVLQSLAVLLGKRPPKNHRLLVLATTSNVRALKELQLYDAFDAHLHVPSISTRAELRKFLCDEQMSVFDEASDELERVVAAFPDTSDADHYEIPVKKLIMTIEMAKQGGRDKFVARLVQALKKE